MSEENKTINEEAVENAEAVEETVEETEAAEEIIEEAKEAEEVEETAEAEEAPAEEGTKGKRFWQKQGKKEPKKDPRDEQIAELNDRVTRQLAEFENFRKRTEKEKIQNYMVGAKDVLEKMLPIVDNFERGLQNADLSDPFAEGMDKVYKQMLTALEQLGVTPMEAEGKEFDPNLHNAVMHIEDENLGENVVAAELQKGYMYKDQVLRYAMVQVAN